MRTELGSMPTKKSYEIEDEPNILSPGRVTPRTPQRAALVRCYFSDIWSCSYLVILADERGSTATRRDATINWATEW